MIFAQYKHAITFALAIMALAVVVADPGSNDDAEPAVPVAAVTRSAPQDRPVPAVAAADPEWYGAPADAAEPAITPEVQAADIGAQEGGNDIAPPPAAQDGTDVAPPPPPQTFQP